MSIFYSMGVESEKSSVKIDGTEISIKDLKLEIVNDRKLSSITEFDLAISDFQSKEVYSDESKMLKRGTHVQVGRVPMPRGEKKVWRDERSGVKELMVDPNVVSSSSEEGRLEQVLAQSGNEYGTEHWEKIRKQRVARPLAGEAPRLEKRFAAGIPAAMLIKAENTNKSVKTDTSGTTMMTLVELEGYSQEKVENIDWLTDKQEKKEKKSESTLPAEVICVICKEMLTSAVLLPCCTSGACDECARERLVDTDHVCPVCNTPGISPEDIVPNNYLRKKVASLGGQPVKRETRPPSPCTDRREDLRLEDAVLASLTENPMSPDNLPVSDTPAAVVDGKPSGAESTGRLCGELASRLSSEQAGRVSRDQASKPSSEQASTFAGEQTSTLELTSRPVSSLSDTPVLEEPSGPDDKVKNARPKSTTPLERSDGVTPTPTDPPTPLKDEKTSPGDHASSTTTQQSYGDQKSSKAVSPDTTGVVGSEEVYTIPSLADRSVPVRSVPVINAFGHTFNNYVYSSAQQPPNFYYFQPQHPPPYPTTGNTYVYPEEDETARWNREQGLGRKPSRKDRTRTDEKEYRNRDSRYYRSERSRDRDKDEKYTKTYDRSYDPRDKSYDPRESSYESRRFYDRGDGLRQRTSSRERGRSGERTREKDISRERNMSQERSRERNLSRERSLELSPGFQDKKPRPREREVSVDLTRSSQERGEKSSPRKKVSGEKLKRKRNSEESDSMDEVKVKKEKKKKKQNEDKEEKSKKFKISPPKEKKIRNKKEKEESANKLKDFLSKGKSEKTSSSAEDSSGKTSLSKKDDIKTKLDGVKDLRDILKNRKPKDDSVSAAVAPAERRLDSRYGEDREYTDTPGSGRRGRSRDRSSQSRAKGRGSRSRSVTDRFSQERSQPRDLHRVHEEYGRYSQDRLKPDRDSAERLLAGRLPRGVPDTPPRDWRAKSEHKTPTRDRHTKIENVTPSKSRNRMEPVPRPRDRHRRELETPPKDRLAKIESELSSRNRHAKIESESPPRNRHAKIESELPPKNRHAMVEPESPPRKRQTKVEPESPPRNRHAKVESESPPKYRHAKVKPKLPPKNRHAKVESESPPKNRHAKIESESPPRYRHAKDEPESPPINRHAKSELVIPPRELDNLACIVDQRGKDVSVLPGLTLGDDRYKEESNTPPGDRYENTPPGSRYKTGYDTSPEPRGERDSPRPEHETSHATDRNRKKAEALSRTSAVSPASDKSPCREKAQLSKSGSRESSYSCPSKSSVEFPKENLKEYEKDYECYVKGTRLKSPRSEGAKGGEHPDTDTTLSSASSRSHSAAGSSGGNVTSFLDDLPDTFDDAPQPDVGQADVTAAPVVLADLKQDQEEATRSDKASRLTSIGVHSNPPAKRTCEDEPVDTESRQDSDASDDKPEYEGRLDSVHKSRISDEYDLTLDINEEDRLDFECFSFDSDDKGEAEERPVAKPRRPAKSSAGTRDDAPEPEAATSSSSSNSADEVKSESVRKRMLLQIKADLEEESKPKEEAPADKILPPSVETKDKGKIGKPGEITVKTENLKKRPYRTSSRETSTEKEKKKKETSKHEKAGKSKVLDNDAAIKEGSSSVTAKKRRVLDDEKGQHATKSKNKSQKNIPSSEPDLSSKEEMHKSDKTCDKQERRPNSNQRNLKYGHEDLKQPLSRREEKIRSDNDRKTRQAEKERDMEIKREEDREKKRMENVSVERKKRELERRGRSKDSADRRDEEGPRQLDLKHRTEESISVSRTVSSHHEDSRLREKKKERHKIGDSKRKDVESRLDDRHRLDDRRRLEESRREEENRRREEVRRKEEARRLEVEENRRKEIRRLEEIKRKEEIRREEEIRKKDQERRRQEEERKQEELRRLEEERRRRDEPRDKLVDHRDNKRPKPRDKGSLRRDEKDEKHYKQFEDDDRMELSKRDERNRRDRDRSDKISANVDLYSPEVERSRKEEDRWGEDDSRGRKVVEYDRSSEDEETIRKKLADLEKQTRKLANKTDAEKKKSKDSPIITKKIKSGKEMKKSSGRKPAKTGKKKKQTSKESESEDSSESSTDSEDSGEEESDSSSSSNSSPKLDPKTIKSILGILAKQKKKKKKKPKVGKKGKKSKKAESEEETEEESDQEAMDLKSLLMKDLMNKKKLILPANVKLKKRRREEEYDQDEEEDDLQIRPIKDPPGKRSAGGPERFAGGLEDTVHSSSKPGPGKQGKAQQEGVKSSSSKNAKRSSSSDEDTSESVPEVKVERRSLRVRSPSNQELEEGEYRSDSD